MRDAYPGSTEQTFHFESLILIDIEGEGLTRDASYDEGLPAPARGLPRTKEVDTEHDEETNQDEVWYGYPIQARTSRSCLPARC